MEAIFIPFITITVAELLDKSQLAIILLTTRVKNYVLLFLGALVGFAIVDGAGIVLGASLAKVIPSSLITLLSAVLFIIFGILALRSNENNEKIKTTTSRSAPVAGFLAIFLSEWGDKTQVASAAFGAKYDPLLVFVGVILAQALLAILAIVVGRLLMKKIDKSLLTKIAGVLFIILGIIFLVSLT